jgi:hypothetical protein
MNPIRIPCCLMYRVSYSLTQRKKRLSVESNVIVSEEDRLFIPEEISEINMMPCFLFSDETKSVHLLIFQSIIRRKKNCDYSSVSTSRFFTSLTEVYAIANHFLYGIIYLRTKTRHF